MASPDGGFAAVGLDQVPRWTESWSMCRRFCRRRRRRGRGAGAAVAVLVLLRSAHLASGAAGGGAGAGWVPGRPRGTEGSIYGRGSPWNLDVDAVVNSSNEVDGECGSNLTWWDLLIEPR
ncbi:protein GDAP2-like protein [Iris pallida]|uniref:Protein GDAP2-like protein n=1 Tax=Iris pallida TaxID=29817 RepID=A0AAX6ERW1_IRIPA|nr:protein GDAP2-like protein [Iris pallida]